MFGILNFNLLGENALMPTPLGEKIYNLRTEKKLTLDELATLSGSSKSYIWELENKSPPRPSAEKLSNIASALGVTLEFLMDQKDEISPDDAKDEKFYREYKEMDAEVKKKIRKMVDLWKDE